MPKTYVSLPTVPIINMFGGPKQSTPSSPPNVHPPSAKRSFTKSELVNIAVDIARKHGVPPALFVRQIEKESGFNPEARGQAGEIGIAQIIPKFHPGVNPYDPIASLEYAAQLMSNYFQRYGNWAYALAAYNAGPTAVDTYRGIPPYRTTIKYVRDILTAAWRDITSSPIVIPVSGARSRRLIKSENKARLLVGNPPAQSQPSQPEAKFQAIHLIPLLKTILKSVI